MASAAVQQASSHSTTFEPLQVNGTRSRGRDVQTTLNYYKPNEDGSPPEPAYVGKPQSYERPTYPLNVTVHDISPEVEKYKLDKQGFEIYSHESTEKEFIDDDKIKAEYYPETEQLLKDAYVPRSFSLTIGLLAHIARVRLASSSSTTLSAVRMTTSVHQAHHSADRCNACISTSPTTLPAVGSPFTCQRTLTSSSRLATRSSTSGDRSSASSKIL